MLPRKTLVLYLVSLFVVAAAIGIRLLLDPLIGPRNPFFTVFLGVVFMAWWGGSGAAWVTTMVGVISTSYFLLEPRHTFAIDKLEHQIAILLFGIVCFATITLFSTLRKARQRAAENSELLRATLASIGDGVITIDKDGLVSSVNAVAASLTGWGGNEAAGQPVEKVFCIVNEATRQPVENPTNRALKEGVVVGLANHTILISRDGTERPIDDSAAPIRNKDGVVVGCVLVFRDITERRRLERQASDRAAAARVLASVVESSEDAIITKSLEGIIQSWNASSQRLFGYSAEQIVGRNITLLIPDDRLAEESHILAQLRAGKNIEAYDTVRIRSDGQPLQVSLTISPVRDETGQVIGAAKIVRDVSQRKKAEEALRRSERELSDFFENASIGLHWVGPDGIILRVNQTELDLLGYREEEYVGRHIAEFHVDQPVINDILARLTRGETVVECPARLRCKDGSIVDVAINSSVLFESGRFIHTRCFTRDVTRQKQAEQALRTTEEQFRQSIARSPFPIIIHSEDDAILQVSDGWTQFSGYSIEDIPTITDWTRLAYGEQQASLKQFIDELFRLNETEHTGEYQIRAKDGSQRTWDFYTTPLGVVGQGGKRLLLSTAIDITTRKEAEQNLRRLAAELSEASRRKDEFLATLAHELRNPLAPIRNGLQVMRLVGGNDVIEQARVMMERQLTHLVRLVDDLLDVSRVTSGKLELRRERIELRSVITAAVETSRPVIEPAGHVLTVDIPEKPIYLNGDATRLAQAISNLLNNSAKYTHQGGHLSLQATLASRAASDPGVAAGVEEDEVIVSVKDDGIGIPPHMLGKVFEMFTQVNRSLEKTTGGLGIGLSLVKWLVEMHGGTIEAQSEGEGRGSEFILRLPILSSAAQKVETPPTDDSINSSTRHRILVADDNVDSADSMQQLLELLGHDVSTAHDGLQAVEAAEAFRPNVILLDIGMPRLNGYEACRLIRQQTWSKYAVLIALTGWGQDEDRRRSQEAGFDHHLVKPVDPSTLQKLLAGLQVK